MAKIIDIRDSIISIGTDDGAIKEVRTSDVKLATSRGTGLEPCTS